MEKRKEKKEQRKERERMQLAILEVGERNGEERERSLERLVQDNMLKTGP